MPLASNIDRTLLSELWDSEHGRECTALLEYWALGSTGDEWGEANGEGVETRGWDTVRSKLTEARVQLTGGAGAASTYN